MCAVYLNFVSDGVLCKPKGAVTRLHLPGSKGGAGHPGSEFGDMIQLLKGVSGARKAGRRGCFLAVQI